MVAMQQVVHPYFRRDLGRAQQQEEGIKREKVEVEGGRKGQRKMVWFKIIKLKMQKIK